jgi:hypothetical protein
MPSSISLFSQIIKLINRKTFQEIVDDYDGDTHSKGFSCWDQFTSMLFCHFAQAQSLREICYGIRSCEGKIYHFGITKSPARSTLSYANTRRPWEIYQQLFYNLLDRCIKTSPRKKFHFKSKLYSLDATVIDLCLKLFDWAKYRRTKGAVKLHMVLDHDGYLPCFALITEGKVHEVTIAHEIIFPPGSIVVVDRGYTDYSLFYQWHLQDIYFVIRLKKNATYKVIENQQVPQNSNILSDQIIEFTGYKARKECPLRLRRIEYVNEDDGEIRELITNHFDLEAIAITEIYKERWQIEIFFRILKQNLKIKTFVGTSKNALMIQIWTALITILLIKYLQFQSKVDWSTSNLVALLRWNLFTHKELWEWINDTYYNPYRTRSIQLKLPLWDSKTNNKEGIY